MTASTLDRTRVPAPSELRPSHFPAIDRFQLEGGVPGLFSRTEGLPVATFSLILPAGALREPSGRAGLATVTGSLLESGAGGMSATEIAEKLESLGVRLSIGTSWEISHLDFTVLPNRAVEAASVVAELLRAPTFPEAEFERIRSEQQAAILQRRADPRGLANEMTARYIFAEDSPFSRPLAGTPETLASLKHEDVRSFHQAAFTPRATTFLAAGNLSEELVLETATAALGGWAGDPAPKCRAGAEPRSRSARVILVERPGAVQSEIRVGHVGVPRDTPDYFPIIVMNTILGGAFSSRLNLNLREKHGFTYGVSSTFVMRKQPGPFLVSTAVQTEVTGRAVAEIRTELDRIRSSPVSTAEIADARQYVAGTFPLRLQTTDGVASCLAELVIHNLDDGYFDQFAGRVLDVTEAQVRDAAERYLHPEEAMILIVGDPTQVLPQLETLGIAEIERVATPGAS